MRRPAFLLALCITAQACTVRTWSSVQPDVRPPSPQGGWTRVQVVADDTDIEVRIRLGPNAYRDIRGRFAAATTDTLTVAQNGSEQTLDRQDILMVRAERPPLNRPAGWIAFGVLAGIAIALFPSGGDLSFPYVWMFVAPPGSIPFFIASAMETIYTAP